MLTEAIHSTEAGVTFGVNIPRVRYRLPTDESASSRPWYVAIEPYQILARQGPFDGRERLSVQQESDISRILRKA